MTAFTANTYSKGERLPMKVTIKDIARLADVSIATVSRTLNMKEDVRSETRDRILAIAKELNYQPNMMAKGLMSKHVYSIGIIIPDITNTYFAEIFRGVEEIASAEGYLSVFYNTDYNVENERNALTLLKAGRVDGLIMQMSNRVTDECKSMAAMGYPIVLLGQFLEGVQCPMVGCNNFASAYNMVEYLIRCGHRDIAHVGGHRETRTGIQRMQGYQSAMDNYGIPVRPQWSVATNYGLEDAYDQTMAMLSHDPLPTAIFAANDSIAAGCYRAIWDRGLRVPDDISLAGHDDTSIASIMRPHLTTMRQQKREIGRIAARKLITGIRLGKPMQTDIVIVPTELVERESVRNLSKTPPRQGAKAP